MQLTITYPAQLVPTLLSASILDVFDVSSVSLQAMPTP